MESMLVTLGAFLLSPLAVYRLARMISQEDGPVDAFQRWRDYLGQKTWVGRGFHCPLCISFWAGFFVAGLLLFWVGQLIVLAIGLSGVVAILVRLGY